MKIKLIDFGLEKDHYPFRPHENDAGADVYMPYDCTDLTDSDMALLELIKSLSPEMKEQFLKQALQR